jgi:hypothetical protein
MLRRTPCIGICSTTYGDLVCRGCKRFAHEIVGWNGYDGAQRGAVWARLLALRGGATRHFVEVVDAGLLTAVAGLTAPAAGAPRAAAGGAVPVAREPAADADPYLVAYEVLRQYAGVVDPLDAVLARLGLRALDPALAAVEDLLRRIDQEFYERSMAQYERNFRTPAR